eukprot:Pgem_evm1s8689
MDQLNHIKKDNKYPGTIEIWSISVPFGVAASLLGVVWVQSFLMFFGIGLSTVLEVFYFKRLASYHPQELDNPFEQLNRKYPNMFFGMANNYEFGSFFRALVSAWSFAVVNVILVFGPTCIILVIVTTWGEVYHKLVNDKLTTSV